MSAVRKAAPQPQQAGLRERATSLKESLAHASRRETSASKTHPREFADRFDFRDFTVAEVARLAEAARMVSDMWVYLGNAPYCYRGNGADCIERPIRGTYDFEAERIGFLRDRCIRELEGRVPQNRWERDEILSARLVQELNSNGDISEPGLLIEAVKAWG